MKNVYGWGIGLVCCLVLVGSLSADKRWRSGWDSDWEANDWELEKPAITRKSAQVAKKPAPVKKKPTPVVKKQAVVAKPALVVKKPVSVVAKPVPVIEKPVVVVPAPVVVKPATVVVKPALVVEKPAPVVQAPEIIKPVTGVPAPVVEKPVSAITAPAPVGTYQGYTKKVVGPVPLPWITSTCGFDTFLNLLYALQPRTLDLLLQASDATPPGTALRAFFASVYAGAAQATINAARAAAYPVVYNLKSTYNYVMTGEIASGNDPEIIGINGSEILLLKDFNDRFGWKNLKNDTGAPLVEIQMITWEDLGNIAGKLAQYIKGQQVLVLDVGGRFDGKIWQETAVSGQTAAQVKAYGMIPLTYTSPQYGTYDLVGMSVTQSHAQGQFYDDYHVWALVGSDPGTGVRTWYFADDDDNQDRQYRKIDDPLARMGSYALLTGAVAKDVTSFLQNWPKFRKQDSKDRDEKTVRDSMYHPGMLVYEKRA